ncbi:MAG: aminoacyl-tRNA hydrolase [Dictyoglomus sp.]|nr:aminoacyl-tRNA hydrolase [Dictyoglomus sp.]MCX7941625.1 aminoacyl-tRNA hydrolase [Dictyoglomaceae bacterium]MDW8187756.1 aminoacyl-tRNA hydrolase [Dictyoglomus sp.]
MTERLAIIGLGNPGFEYSRTRHNIGFMIVDYLQNYFNFPKYQIKALYHVTFKEILNKKIYLIKPQTYMNLSGIGVKEFLLYQSLDLREILVVHDDLDLELGRIRIRYNGKDGGHKGIKSIIEELNSKDFYRMRIGIGRPRSKEEIVEYVLSNFKDEEIEIIHKVIKLTPEIVKVILEEGWEKAQNIFNRKCLP